MTRNAFGFRGEKASFFFCIMRTGDGSKDSHLVSLSLDFTFSLESASGYPYGRSLTSLITIAMSGVLQEEWF